MPDRPSPPNPGDRGAGARRGGGHARGLAQAGSLHLDDLLAEIGRRAEGATRTTERLASLLDAVVAISSALDLRVVLERIVASACTLADARYGALGVLDGAGIELAEFITVGLDPVERGRLVEPPRGHGILGLLIREPRPLRLADLRDHPASVGIPRGHPPMGPFIGSPIRVRDRVFGNLYLTRAPGAREFGDQDASMLEGLAAAAGIAVENAQMYRDAQMREQWAQVLGELTRTLLEGRHEHSVLARMVKHACDLGGADLGTLAIREDDGSLVVAAVGGPAARDSFVGTPLEGIGFALILRSRVPVLVMGRTGDTHRDDLVHELAAGHGLETLGSCAVVPITVGEVEVGVIALAWPFEDRHRAFETIDSLTRFADAMGLAIEASRAQRQRERAALLEERDRIARDMHDHVIQRLYATGLSLQVTSRGLEGSARDRVEAAVSELDLAVKDLRHAIFELHSRLPEGGLGPEIETLVAQAAQVCGFVPDVAFDGLLSHVPVGMEQDVLAVVREGLSNIVRHARAGDAQILLSVHDDVLVVVQDDGVGIDDAADRRGLVNLQDRALAHGGAFSVTSRSPRGTMLRWRAPVRS
ncbi:sensor histidine kinase [Agilicoccus flavus]|uniref:sensor histidine kinase n=1 Tax=Agilicoccus flavus TaxID=2775968 RepID=UPI001CF70FD1|nr:GAF domain-containing protein [Agilicoccus flavus]